MPIEKGDAVAPPRKPHLGLMAKDGSILAIPPGTMMVIVEDPSRVDGVMPLLLVEVSRNKLLFVPYTTTPGPNTRYVEFKANWKGKFVSQFSKARRVDGDDELEELLK